MIKYKQAFLDKEATTYSCKSSIKELIYNIEYPGSLESIKTVELGHTWNTDSIAVSYKAKEKASLSGV